MESFNKKSFFELRKMELQLIEKYYNELRKYEFENNIPLKGIELRKKLHKLCYLIVKLDRLLSKEDLFVIGDQRIESSKPKIYACTHIGGNDIQRTFEAIKEHAYLFLGDPKELYVDITGLLLRLNGVIAMDSFDKEDRRIAYQRSVELLDNNGNLLIYPEGAWNISRNKPVMKLFPGVAKMAKETGADIIPVAIEQYGNDFFVNIGNNMEYKSGYSSNIDGVTEDLRTNMATLKYDIWRNMGTYKRSDLDESLFDSFEQEIVDRCGYKFSIQDVLDTMHVDSDISDFVENEVLKKK